MPCDASGMAEIHRFFKKSFGEGSDLVIGVTQGDAVHAERVGAHLHMVALSLHSHHEFEDQNFWGPLAQRSPGCALHVGRMQAQHAEMLVHLDALDAALPAWRLSGSRTDARPVLDALAGVNAALAVHLPDEESTVVPVMEEVLEQKEMDAAAAHGRKSTPKGYTWPMLGHILAAQPDGGTVWLRTHMPPPIRWLWHGFGRRRYTAYRRDLVNTAEP